jgi:alpha-D-ribose 1-methylphosphonate 5-triphosphate synthase subunit PhnH
MNAADLRERRFDFTFDSQALFRRLLDATARPGTLVRLEPPVLEVPAPALRPACALLLALLDLEVGIHVVGADAPRLADYLVANTGAMLMPLEAADFVLVAGPDSGGRIRRCKRGSLAAPHEGATLVYAPHALGAAPAEGRLALRLRGPGIPETRHLAVAGVSEAEIAAWRSLVDFPLGVDIWLAAADGTLAVLPRSTAWEREG